MINRSESQLIAREKRNQGSKSDRSATPRKRRSPKSRRDGQPVRPTR